MVDVLTFQHYFDAYQSVLGGMMRASALVLNCSASGSAGSVELLVPC